MRVLIIVDPQITVPPVCYGGTERIAALLARELRNAGHEVRLMAAHGSTDYGGGLVVHRAPTQATPSRAFRKLYFQWLSYYALDGVDVVVNFARLDYLRLIALSSRPLVVWFQNPVRQSEIDYLNRIRLRRRCDVFISESQSSPLKNLGNRVVIHNAVDMDFFAFGPTAAAPLYAVFLGRLTQNKGVHLAIDVARRAGIHLKIAGNVSHEQGGREYFEQVVQPELGRGCEWVGEVDDVQKRELLQGASALLFPIKWTEPFGIVMAESLACGTPVIALRRASVPEVIRHGENGYICDQVDEMVTALRQVGAISRKACRDDAVKRFGAELFLERSLIAIERAGLRTNPTRLPQLKPPESIPAKAPKTLPARKRTILVIVDPQNAVPPRWYGGAERIAALLCTGLQQTGWRVRLMAGPGSADFGDGLWIHRAPSQRLFSRAFRKLLFLQRSRRVIEGCDVVVTFGRLDYLAGLLRTRIPLVCRFGNPVTQREINFIEHRRKEARNFVFISQDQCRDLQKAVPARVVYNAVDVDLFSPIGRPVAQRDYLLFLGRLTRNKGVHLAIEAARRTDSKLVIAGNISNEPGDAEFFEDEVRPCLGSRCSWVGPVDDFRKRALLREARALLFPIQWREPFGIVMAESLACGTPVIAMSYGSVPEVVRHGLTGFVCTTLGEFCDSIHAVHRLSDEQCREDALARFSIRPFLEGMTAAIGQACDEHASAAGLVY